MLSDIECLLRCCEAKLPIFFCAFGFGCTILMSLLIDNPHLPINGFIVVSPTIVGPGQPKTPTRIILKWLCRCFLGDLLVHMPLNMASLTKDNNQLKKMIDEGSQVQYVK